MVILQNTTYLQTFRFLQKSVVDEANIHPAHCCELGSVSLDITENGEYSVLPPRGCDGISSADITIDVPDNYNEGFEDGVEEQKSKLTSLAVYSNGTYTREDGYNEVVVNVPTSGDCVDWSAAGFSCNDLDFINEQMPVIQEAKAYLDSGRTANGTTPIGNTGYTFNELVLLPSGKYVSLQSCTAAILAGDVVSTYYSEFFFMGCSALNSIRSFTLLGGSAPTNTQFMFSDCASLRKAPTVDTSATTNAM